MNINKPDFKSIQFKGGAKTSLISFAAIAIVVALNIIVGIFKPTLDFSSNKAFKITKDTKKYIAELKDDITIYYLQPEAIENAYIDPILREFEKSSSHIDVVVKDPVLYPTFGSEYTDEEVEDYSLVVVDEVTGRSRYIPVSDMLLIDYELNYNTYQYEEYLAYLDIEGQIDAAISYVSGTDLPKVYEIVGHGEATLGEEGLALLSKANIDYEQIRLLLCDSVPEDCTTLLLETPANDITADEADLIIDYIAKGGNAVFNVTIQDLKHPNILRVLGEYGIGITDGIIFDPGNRLNSRYPDYYFLGDTTSSDITGTLADKYLIVQYVSALTVDDSDTSLMHITEINTSDEAYIRPLDADVASKQAGDPSGRFTFGYHVTDSDSDGEICVYSGLGLFDDAYASDSAYANLNLLINSVKVMSGIEEGGVSVPKVSTIETGIINISDATTSLYFIVLFSLIPLTMLVCGIVITVGRRRKG